jgi:hypothetical protein
MSHTLDRAGTKFGYYRDLALGFLFASSLSLGVFFLLNARSPQASALDMKLALGSLALAGLCLVVAPSKLTVLLAGFVFIAGYAMTMLVLRLIGTRSPIAGIVEIALGATLLFLMPPGWHKRRSRLTFPALLLLHGAYQLFRA